MRHWFRLSVDVDAAGNTKGASYEVFDSFGERITFGTVAIGPFDTLTEALQAVEDYLAHGYGLNFPLF